MVRAKYGNKRFEADGIRWQSKKEYNRWLELKADPRVKDLQRQVPFELIPKTGKQRAASYIADFTYTLDGKPVVEDSKGFRTEVYKIKKKLMMWIHGIQIKET